MADGQGEKIDQTTRHDLGPMAMGWGALQSHLAAIVESSDDAIVSKNLDGIILSWNRGAERVFGYTAEEIVGKPILILLPEDRKNEETVILSRIRRGVRVDHFETIRRRKDGRLINVSVTISPIRDETGKVVAASKVARDITMEIEARNALKRLNDELEDMVRERTRSLEESNRELEGFTYSVSHDLRAPLRAIIATSRILVEDYGPDLPTEARNLLERQVEAGNRLGTLIDELLQFSRLGNQDVVVSDVDLSAMAHEVAAELHPPQNMRLQVEPGLRCKADPSLMRLVMRNFLENAIKFSPNGGCIRIGRDGNTFFVSDEGVGFDMQYAPRIFVPFERLVRNEEFPGTGIGLANVKRILDRHGGRVWVESQPGLGTTFFFTVGPSEAVRAA